MANDLSQLEDSFFQHEYPKENVSSRLERLEKFIFGEAKEGSDESRITHLLLAVPADRLPPEQATTATKKRTASSDDSADTDPKPVSKSGWESPSDTESGSDREFDESNYARLTKLEQQVLGKSYPNDDIEKRVDRLEKAEFGSLSPSPHIGDRLTILEAYARRHGVFDQYASSSPVSNEKAVQETDSSAGKSSENSRAIDSEAGNLVVRVGAMEKEIFGRSYPNRPLPERIRRLEKEIGVDSHELAQKDLPSQADLLWSQIGSGNNERQRPQTVHSYKAKMEPASDEMADADDSNGLNDRNGNDGQGQTTGDHQSWLHKLGKALGSMAAGTLMSPSFSPYGSPYGMYGSPYGMYGSPYGMYSSPYGMYGSPYGMYASRYGMYGSPYGNYGNSYLNPGFAPWGGGGYYPGLRQFAGW